MEWGISLFTLKSLARHTLILAALTGGVLSAGTLPASAATGTLVFSQFRCLEETNEIGSDSPYFLVFSASGSNPDLNHTVLVRQPHWDDEVDSGEAFSPNTAVATVNSNSLVLAAVVEEDDGPDLSSSDVNSIRNHMH